MNLTEPIVNGFVLGLSTGPVCLATCFPAVLPFALGERSPGDGPGRRWRFLAQFIGGRFIAYLAFGFAIGSLGSSLPPSTTRIGVVAWMVLALVLVAYGLGANVGHTGLCRYGNRFVGSRHFPLVLGALTGLSVCPPFLLALSYTLERSANAAYGTIFFFAFFCATTLYILPIGLVGHVPRHALLDRLGRVAAVVAGGLFFYKGVLTLMVT